MLIENGFTPEWITLQKEIRQDIEALRQNLRVEREHFSPNPLNPQEVNTWREVTDKYVESTHNINKKINKFNLVVPVLNKQMLCLNLDKEASNVLLNGRSNVNCNRNKIEKEDPKKYSDDKAGSVGLFGFLDTILKK